MSRFSYVAKNSAGKTIRGIEDATSEENLVQKLQKQGFFVVNVQPFSFKEGKGTIEQKFTHNRAKLTDLLVFCRQLATMLESGITIIRSLDIISRQVDSKQFYNVLKSVRKDVENGIALSASMAKHPKVFNQFWVSLVEVGEASGTMPSVLEKLAFYLEQRAAFQSTIISAMIYPAVLFCVAIGAILSFALFVGPRFKDIFMNFDIELPLITVLLLNSFDFIKTKFLLLLFIIGVILLVVRNYAQTSIGKKHIEDIVFRLPQFGHVFKLTVIERFTSQMSILVDSGVPILYALDITQRMIGNKTCEAIISRIMESVREGRLIAESMHESGFFPPMAVQMINIGEETGELGKMLKNVSDYYQEFVSTYIDRKSVV